jgi:hypothetical protein
VSEGGREREREGERGSEGGKETQCVSVTNGSVASMKHCGGQRATTPPTFSDAVRPFKALTIAGVFAFVASAAATRSTLASSPDVRNRRHHHRLSLSLVALGG